MPTSFLLDLYINYCYSKIIIFNHFFIVFFLENNSCRYTKICLLNENEKIEFINEMNEKFMMDGITEEGLHENIKEIKSEYYKQIGVDQN